MRPQTLLPFVAAGLLVAVAAPTAAHPTRAARDSASSVAVSHVVAAVGDTACDPADPQFNLGIGTSTRCAQLRVSDRMVADLSLEAVLGLGDYQYDCGEPSDYAVSYTPSYGRLNPIMDPTVGNHEYKTGTDAFGAQCPTDNATAANYFTYFGAAAHPETQGHFSFDLGSWHLVGLNANCSKPGVGGCSTGSAQSAWLRADLAATTQPCVLAYWHQPRYSGAGTGIVGVYKPWWDALYAAHADVVLNGHRHNYQRYAALDPSGRLDPVNGVTEYVVGTGGEEQVTVAASALPRPAVWIKTFGYLRLVLGDAGWTTEFVDSTGAVLDTSSGSCHQ